MSDKFSLTTATGSNLPRIHALSSALAVHACTYASKGTARVQFAALRAALMGTPVDVTIAHTVRDILTAAGEGWEEYASELDELTGKGKTLAYLPKLDSRDVFTGKGEGSIPHLFNVLIMADLANMPEWVALPDRAPTRVKGATGGKGVPAVYDFATAGVSDALLTIIRYSAAHDVEFNVRHGVGHVKAGNKYIGTVNANGDQVGAIAAPDGSAISTPGKQMAAQKSEAALIFAARNYGKLKKATQGATARKVGEFLMDCTVSAPDAVKAVGAARPVWQHCPPALRDAALAALQKDGPAEESFIVGLTGVKVLS